MLSMTTKQDAETTQRLVFLLEYDGTNLFGSQAQRHRGSVLPTVEDTLILALRNLGIPIHRPLILASRTDAGVHAYGQVAHVDTAWGALRQISCLASALNAKLPAAIAVKAVQLQADPNFHSRHSALARWYRYRIFTAPFRSPHTANRSWHIRRAFSLEALSEAAAQVIGVHSFDCFQAVGSVVRDTRCHVYHCAVQQTSETEIEIDIVANRFLYKMVRILVGTMVTIALNPSKNPPGRISEYLTLGSHGPNCLGPVAPAQGLFLMAIHYPTVLQYFSTQGLVQHLNQQMQTEFTGDENLFCNLPRDGKPASMVDR